MAHPHSHRPGCNRRAFLRTTATIAAGVPFMSALPGAFAQTAPALSPGVKSNAKVAIAACKGYGAEVRPALQRCFDLLGGVKKLVNGKTTTVKINLTGTNFSPFLNRPVGETYMTHPGTVEALVSLLFDSGATRVRLVESTQSRADLPTTLDLAGWDVKRLDGLGKVDYENTRNLGSGKQYAHLKVPAGGYMFSALDLNHAYHDTDVMISLAKLKRHITAGITLSMKNMFGLTPNSLYGGQAGTEDATDGRGPLHSAKGYESLKLPGFKPGAESFLEPFTRVPRIIVDICAARPIDLAIIDGITAMTGGEGPWTSQVADIKVTTPGIIIAGFNPVSTDAVGTAVMGYSNPRALRGTHPFDYCDNHLLLAEQAGLGSADLTKIDVRGLTIEQAKYQYD